MRVRVHLVHPEAPAEARPGLPGEPAQGGGTPPRDCHAAPRYDQAPLLQNVWLTAPLDSVSRLQLQVPIAGLRKAAVLE